MDSLSRKQAADTEHHSTTILPTQSKTAVSNDLNRPHDEPSSTSGEYTSARPYSNPDIDDLSARLSKLAMKPFESTPGLKNVGAFSRGTDRPSLPSVNGTSSTVSSTKSKIFDSEGSSGSSSSQSSSPTSPIQETPCPAQHGRKTIKQVVEPIPYHQEPKEREASKPAHFASANRASSSVVRFREAVSDSKEAIPSPAPSLAEKSPVQVPDPQIPKTKPARKSTGRRSKAPDSNANQIDRPATSLAEKSPVQALGSQTPKTKPARKSPGRKRNAPDSNANQIVRMEGEIETIPTTTAPTSETSELADNIPGITSVLDITIWHDDRNDSSEREENPTSTPVTPQVVDSFPTGKVQPASSVCKSSTRGNKRSTVELPVFELWKKNPKGTPNQQLFKLLGGKGPKTPPKLPKTKTHKDAKLRMEGPTTDVRLKYHYIYIFKVDYVSLGETPPELSHVKIGRTINPPATRMGQWEGRCGLPFVLIEDSLEVPFYHGELAENLIHAELSKERRKFKCGQCAVSHQHTPPVEALNISEKAKFHGEWFEVDETKALEVVHRWRGFISDSKPYNQNGMLKPFWQERYDRLPANLQNPNVWENFLRPRGKKEDAAVFAHIIQTEANNDLRKLDFSCRTFLEMLKQHIMFVETLLDIKRYIFVFSYMVVLSWYASFLWALSSASVVMLCYLMKVGYKKLYE